MSTDTSASKWLRELIVELAGERTRVDELIAAAQLLADYQNSKTPRQPAASQEDIVRGAVDILLKHEEPIHRRIIHEELRDQGIHVGGKDPVANLGAILSRQSKVFDSVGNGVWGLLLWKQKSQNQSNGNGVQAGTGVPPQYQTAPKLARMPIDNA